MSARPAAAARHKAAPSTRFAAALSLVAALMPVSPARADTTPHAAPPAAPPAALTSARPSFLTWTEAGPTDSLRLDWPGDGIVTVGALVLWGGSQLLRGSIAPKHCNVCSGVDNTGLPGDPGAGPGDLNGVDAYFHDHLTGWLVSRKSADTISNVLGYGLVPVGGGLAALAFTGPHASDHAGPRALVIAAESVAITGFLGQAFKFGLARKRPFVRYGHGTDGSTDAEGSTYDVNDPESHFSFPSGHTSVTAAVTVS
ncbi:MAG: phosphatase PAP2 family protein, partial [Deltaproteobacteria bacterium]|nr:phosphatase PAP2 family protein [Deltaproteobacteria bacterium]